MISYGGIRVVAFANGYIFKDHFLPQEVCLCSVEKFEENGNFIDIDLSKINFDSYDSLINKCFAEKHFGLEFPPPKLDVVVPIEYVKLALNKMHEELGGGIIGCVGLNQTSFFLQYGLPSVNIQPIVPPYEDLLHLPLNLQYQVHKPENALFCSINFAQRYAWYLNRKSQAIQQDKTGLMSRLCTGPYILKQTDFKKWILSQCQ